MDKINVNPLPFIPPYGFDFTNMIQTISSFGNWLITYKLSNEVALVYHSYLGRYEL
jgi:hypothetical protein